MRWIGAAAIMLASFGTGCISVFQMQKRIHALRDMCDTLTFLSGELATKQSPLPEALESCRQYSKGEAFVFFRNITESLSQLGTKSFLELWENTVAQETPYLSHTEKSELLSLGGQLGRTSLSIQLAALESGRNLLSTMLEREERLYQQERRMRLALPSAAGAMLLILLL